MNEKIKKVLRVLKARGLEQSTPVKELAGLTGLSRQIISISKSEIEAYSQSAPPPSTSDEAFVDKQSIDTYVDIALTSGKEERHFAQVTGAVAGFVLRHHSDLINNIQTPKKVVRVGQGYLSLVAQTEARKGAKGTPVHSQSGAAKYLLTELNNSTLVKELFSRSNSYRADAYSKTWKLTAKAEQLNKLIMREMIKLIDEHNTQQIRFTHSPVHMRCAICSGKSVKRNPKSHLPIEDRYFEIPVQALGTLSVPSFLQVMALAEPYPFSCVTIPLKNLASVDPDKGRTYNIFTRLRSSERKALGYHNYDISGGLQIICFNILYQYPNGNYQDFYDLKDAYPLIFEYGNDPGAKQALRQGIANDLGISIDEVKKLLTAYANGSQKKVGSSSKLQEFFKESDQLRREVIAVIAASEPKLLKSAIQQSNKSFPGDMDWKSSEKENDRQVARDKASVFFFIWTYFEKQVRDVMLSVVDDGIPVHDAIYSKHDIDCEIFEKAVGKQNGFVVKIGH